MFSMNHEKNAKAAINALGPKAILELVQKYSEQLSKDACNTNAEAKWADTAYRLSKITEKM